MDDMLQRFNSASFSGNTENEANKSRFDAMYKNWGKLENQEQRRRSLLDVQKCNRNSKVDTCRGILNYVKKQNFQVERLQSGYRPSIYVAGFTKAPTSYRNVLMMSEWLVEKPADFEEDWFVVPCPKGVRTLVVASKGNTVCYNKYGRFRLCCKTALPGGNPHDSNFMNNCVVLDCFHVQSLNTLYILDLLAWNNQPMTDGETDFRHYWLKTHIEDIPELKTINDKNKILFQLLPKHDCSRKSLNEFMMMCPYFENNSPALDGLLFYHKMAHYVSGTTPLVGWLYPFMVHEVLGPDITVNELYRIGAPVGYVNQATFIAEFESKAATQLESNSKNEASAMDTTPAVGESSSGVKTGRRKNKKGSRDAEMAESSNTVEMPLYPDWMVVPDPSELSESDSEST